MTGKMNNITVITAESNNPAEYLPQWNAELSKALKDRECKYISFKKPAIKESNTAYDRLHYGINDYPYQVEMALAGYEIAYGEDTVFKTPEKTKRVLSSDDMLCRIFYMENEQGFVFNKVMKSDIIRRLRLKFRTDIGIGAERLFLTEYIKHCDSILMLPERVFVWDMEDDAPGYDDLTVKALSVTRKKLLFKPDARWILDMDLNYFKNEEYDTEDE